MQISHQFEYRKSATKIFPNFSSSWGRLGGTGGGLGAVLDGFWGRFGTRVEHGFDVLDSFQARVGSNWASGTKLWLIF